ncbi:uncharacterized protein LOC141903716 isoform X2 [Tubulanus polymorphus]|uniref:uncharacterized protein LOC141903716 isoform X2 n=1 Tax=Tubulanus polymorphus TaxID=672921 RepID=UPI003DA40A6D
MSSSWWNASNFSSLATNALKSAQKQIDKVLEIQDENEGSGSSTSSETQKKSLRSANVASNIGGDDFWGAWLESPNEPSNEDSKTKLSLSAESGAVPKSERARSSLKSKLTSKRGHKTNTIDEKPETTIATKDESNSKTDEYAMTGSGSVWGSFGLWGSESLIETKPNNTRAKSNAMKLPSGLKEQKEDCASESGGADTSKQNNSIVQPTSSENVRSSDKPMINVLTESWGDLGRFLDSGSSVVSKLTKIKSSEPSDKPSEIEAIDELVDKQTDPVAVLPSEASISFNKSDNENKSDIIQRSDSAIMSESLNTDDLELLNSVQNERVFPYNALSDQTVENNVPKETRHEVENTVNVDEEDGLVFNEGENRNKESHSDLLHENTASESIGLDENELENCAGIVIESTTENLEKDKVPLESDDSLGYVREETELKVETAELNDSDDELAPKKVPKQQQDDILDGWENDVSDIDLGIDADNERPPDTMLVSNENVLVPDQSVDLPVTDLSVTDSAEHTFDESPVEITVDMIEEEPVTVNDEKDEQIIRTDAIKDDVPAEYCEPMSTTNITDLQSSNLSGSTISESDSDSSQLDKTLTREDFTKKQIPVEDNNMLPVTVESMDEDIEQKPLPTASVEVSSLLLDRREHDVLLSESSSDVTLVGDAGQLSDLQSSSTDQSMNSSSSGEVKQGLVSSSSSRIDETSASNNLSVAKELEVDVGDGLGEPMEESAASVDSSTGSYVKCMLEDAMVESPDVEVTSNNSNCSDKSSELVKVESDQNSGHTSADEIDTTTSSDIEIISTPTPNGEQRDHPFDLSPLRHALSKTLRKVSPPSHKRTDSNSSSSGHSKGSDLEQLSPGRDAYHSHCRDEGFLHLNVERGRALQTSRSQKMKSTEVATDELLASNAFQTEKLLKKLAETAEILEAREKKLLELSKDNMDLHEANSILRNQLQQSEEAREAEMTDLNELTQEFTTRMSESERKIHQIAKDRDNLKKQLTTAQEELAKKIEDKKTKMLLEEKDIQIEELLTEGEKLSKQQLQNSTVIKKLRAKEKDTDSNIKTLKQKIEKLESENSHLREVLDSRDEMEKRQNEVITQLNDAVVKQERELKTLQLELDESQEKTRGLKSTLDGSYKELADLHKVIASKESKVQEISLSAEMAAKEELRLTLEKHKQQSKFDQENLILQVEDLQRNMTRAEKEHIRRENVLRQEISDLQMRLQEGEARNQDLSQNVILATRPLLRQIENLQSTHSAQSISWEKVEKSLIDRLNDAQESLAEATEKERMASDKLIELNSRVSSLDSQATLLRQEKTRLTTTLEMERTKLELLEDTKNKDAVHLEHFKQSMQEEVNNLKREKLLLENQLEMEKLKVETERKKVSLAYEQMREKSVQDTRPHTTTPSPQPSRTRSSSQSSDATNLLPPLTQDEVLEHTMMMSSSSGSKLSLYESMRQNGAANLMENLSSQLKQREGEIAQLQNEIVQLEKTRESMARELVNITNKNVELEEKADLYENLLARYKELDQRYNAILTMYGEKVEETEELRLDLVDMKELYKSQIEELLKKS